MSKYNISDSTKIATNISALPVLDHVCNSNIFVFLRFYAEYPLTHDGISSMSSKVLPGCRVLTC